jgi:hypothetical protein
VHDQLVALFADPARKVGRREAKHLPSGGIARCGRPGCRAALLSKARTKVPHEYACMGAPGRPGCGKLAVTAAPLEAFVTGVLFESLANPRVLAALATDGDGEDGELLAALRADEEALTELAEMFADHQISRAQLTASTQRIEARVEATRRALRRRMKSRALSDLRRPWMGSARAGMTRRRRWRVGRRCCARCSTRLWLDRRGDGEARSTATG